MLGGKKKMLGGKKKMFQYPFFWLNIALDTTFLRLVELLLTKIFYPMLLSETYGLWQWRTKSEEP